MIEQLRLADGTLLPLPAPGQRLALAASGREGVAGPGQAAGGVGLEPDPAGAWLVVDDAGADVVVNGRPVRALAWLHAGDRVCVGSLAFDLLGPAPAALRPPVRSFVLRRRGGSGAGSLLDGPVVSLDAEGQPVSAAAGALEVSLSGGHLGVRADGVPVWLNGHRLEGAAALAPGDQLRVGRARFLVEALPEPAAEHVTQRLAAAPALPAAQLAGNASGLGWMVLLAAVLAALIAALIYL